MTSELAPAISLPQIDSVELLSLCAQDRENSSLWAEFMRRYAPKIKLFIRGTLRQDGDAGARSLNSSATTHEMDLFQNTILRLVENNCAALRRFSGTKESELLAYLAVIARSTVRDFMRRQRAKKRFSWPVEADAADRQWVKTPNFSQEPSSESATERRILAQELERLSLKAIENNSGDPLRDKLIFQLYFYDDLSAAQIAACSGVGLSKAGVEKTLSTLKDRVRGEVTNTRLSEAR
jgi:RNA polymerase sigma factor (sigma-70 family)